MVGWESGLCNWLPTGWTDVGLLHVVYSSHLRIVTFPVYFMCFPCVVQLERPSPSWSQSLPWQLCWSCHSASACGSVSCTRKVSVAHGLQLHSDKYIVTQSLKIFIILFHCLIWAFNFFIIQFQFCHLQKNVFLLFFHFNELNTTIFYRTQTVKIQSTFNVRLKIKKKIIIIISMASF